MLSPAVTQVIPEARYAVLPPEAQHLKPSNAQHCQGLSAVLLFELLWRLLDHSGAGSIGISIFRLRLRV